MPEFLECRYNAAARFIMAALKEPIAFEPRSDIDLKSSKGAFFAGVLCVILTLILYVVFSPLGVAK